LPVKNKLTLAYALSGLLGVLLVVSSLAGVLYGRVGKDGPGPLVLGVYRPTYGLAPR